MSLVQFLKRPTGKPVLEIFNDASGAVGLLGVVGFHGGESFVGFRQEIFHVFRVLLLKFKLLLLKCRHDFVNLPLIIVGLSLKKKRWRWRYEDVGTLIGKECGGNYDETRIKF